MAISFRPTDELSDRLKMQADCEHTSIQGLLVRAAEEYLDRHSKTRRIDEALDLIMERSGTALRRLGEGPTGA
jgi:predicted transcriptional regulator